VAGGTSSNGRSAQRAPSGALKPFVGVVVAIGAAVILHSLAGVAFVPRPYEWMLFAALAIATGSFSVKIASVVATISISDTFFITLALLFGPAPAAIAVAVDSLIMSWRLGHASRRIVLNMAAPAVSIWAGAQMFFVIAGVPTLAHSDVAVGSLIGPLLLMTLIYFALNSGLIATAVGLESGQSPLDIWRRHFQWLGIGYMASASLAFCFVLLIQQVSFLAAIVILPMLAVFHLTLKASYGRLEDARRHLADVDRLYLSTVETLAMAIDAKDDVTHSHVRRVQAYAVGMARALGFTDESTLKAIEAAALLHDTWQIGGARAHPQQAGQTDTIRVREDEASRRRWRRHPVARRFPVSGRSDRALPSRELGRHRLPARRERRGDPDRCPHSVGGRLFRCADVRPSVSPRDDGGSRPRDSAGTQRQDVRPGGGRHVHQGLPRHSRRQPRRRGNLGR
jgi:hypothetical protein